MQRKGKKKDCYKKFYIHLYVWKRKKNTYMYIGPTSNEIIIHTCLIQIKRKYIDQLIIFKMEIKNYWTKIFIPCYVFQGYESDDVIYNILTLFFIFLGDIAK